MKKILQHCRNIIEAHPLKVAVFFWAMFIIDAREIMVFRGLNNPVVLVPLSLTVLAVLYLILIAIFTKKQEVEGAGTDTQPRKLA